MRVDVDTSLCSSPDHVLSPRTKTSYYTPQVQILSLIASDHNIGKLLVASTGCIYIRYCWEFMMCVHGYLIF